MVKALIILNVYVQPYVCSRLGHHAIKEEGSDEEAQQVEEEEEVIRWKKGNRLGKGSFGTVCFISYFHTFQ